MPPRRSEDVAVGAFVLVTVVVGLLLPPLGVILFAPARPFFAFPGFQVSAWALPGLALAAALALCAPRALRLQPAPFALTTALLALAVRICVNVARHGPGELARPFTGAHARDEYPAAAGFARDDPAAFIDRFADLVPLLPTHPAGHPPGPTLLTALIDAAWPLTALILVCGASTAPLVYLLGRRVTGEQAARVAALLWVFMPSVILDGATSMDALFAMVACAATVLLVAQRLATGAVAVAAGALLSYALLAVPVWAGIVVWLGAGWRRGMAVLAAGAAGIGLLVLALWWGYGYEPIGAYEATRRRYLTGIGGLRPDAYWLFGDIAAFLIAAGIAVLPALARSLRARNAAAVALLAVMLLGAASGYSEAEVERIWLFMTPWAAVAAAPHLGGIRLSYVLLALTAQAAGAELLFGTVW